MRSERRSWVARLLVLLAVLLLLIYLVLSARRSDLCDQGYTSRDTPCDAQLFAQRFFSQLSLQAPLDAYVTPPDQPAGFMVPLSFQGQDLRYMNVTWAYRDTLNSGDTPFASWDLGQGTRGVLNVINSFPFGVLSVVDWAAMMALNGVSTMAEQGLLNERLVLSHVNDSNAALRQAACRNNAANPSWFFSGDDAAAQAQATTSWLYPDTALQVANSTVSAAGGGSGRLAYRQVFFTQEQSASIPPLPTTTPGRDTRPAR